MGRRTSKCNPVQERHRAPSPSPQLELGFIFFPIFFFILAKFDPQPSITSTGIRVFSRFFFFFSPFLFPPLLEHSPTTARAFVFPPCLTIPHFRLFSTTRPPFLNTLCWRAPWG